MYKSVQMYCVIQYRLRNDLYCVEWDVKLYYTIPYLSSSLFFERLLQVRQDHPELSRRGTFGIGSARFLLFGYPSCYSANSVKVLEGYDDDS